MKTYKVAADGWTTTELSCSKCRWLAWSVCPLRACLYRELWQGRLSVRACRAALAQSRLLIRSLTGRLRKGCLPEKSREPRFRRGKA